MSINVKNAMDKLYATCRLIMEGKLEGRDMNYWEWNSGVGMFGIMTAAEKTGEKAYIDFMKEWFEKNGGDDRLTGSVNCVIPCCMTLYLLKLTGEEKYKKVCDEYADWAQNRSIKTTNGGMAHVWSIGGLEDYKNQFWADSIFMAGIFLTEYAKETEDKKLAEFAETQIKLHLTCLFDEEENLFNHGYHCITKQRLGGKWGRGNGWVAASLARIMESTSANAAGGVYKEYFVKLIEKAYLLKEENGLLHTLLNRKDSYTEATASMLFAYAAHVGFKLGILDERFLKWSEDVLNAVSFDDDGTVKYTSGGTDCFTDIKNYYGIPFVKSNYADGITFMLLSRFV